MKVIMQKDVAKIGQKYDVKDVSSGHAVNFLIPRGLAVAATPEALKKLETDKARQEGERKVQEELTARNLGAIDGGNFRVSAKANAKGHLFAGIHRVEIANELKSQSGADIDPAFIDLEQPIKTVGEYSIRVNAAGKSAKFKLTIEAA